MTTEHSDVVADVDMGVSLPDRVRPMNWSEFVCQDDLFDENGEIGAALAEECIHSMLLCGSRGCSKSTLAQLVAETLGWHYLSINGQTAAIGDIRDAFDQAVTVRRDGWPGVLLFVEAMDSLSLIVCDALLICAEDGAFVFIGGVTSQPGTDDDTSPLSRVPCYRLNELDSAGIRRILDRVLADDTQGFGGHSMQLDAETRDRIAVQSAGDARWAIERLATIADRFNTRQPESAMVSPDIVDSLLTDADGAPEDTSTMAVDEHPDEQAGDMETVAVSEADTESGTAGSDDAVTSDLVEKSDADVSAGAIADDPVDAMRHGILEAESDTARHNLKLALEAGYSIDHLGRVLLRMASENVGNADPGALRVVLDASDAAARLGGADGEPALAQAAEYLARAPKQTA